MIITENQFLRKMRVTQTTTGVCLLKLH